MRSVVINVLLFLMFFGATSASTPSLDFSSGRHNNVCKDLKNDVLLYFVFVDTRTTSPWTEFDILTTIDSIQVAARWLETQAKKQNVPLNIKTDYYIGDEFTTIETTARRHVTARRVVVHVVSSPIARRSCMRAAYRRDITVPMGILSASAISRYFRPW